MAGDRIARILAAMAAGGDGGRSSVRLCEVTTDVTGVSGAGVTLMSGDVPQGSLCTINPVSALIEELQYTLGEGPCVDAYQKDLVVLEPDLFSVEQTPMDEDDVMIARAFADLATISVVQHRAATETQLVNEQLSEALTSRVLIEQAKGVIFERAGIDMAEAFSRLRNYAHNLLLTAVAQAAIDGTLDPQAWADAHLPKPS